MKRKIFLIGGGACLISQSLSAMSGEEDYLKQLKKRYVELNVSEYTQERYIQDFEGAPYAQVKNGESIKNRVELHIYTGRIAEAIEYMGASKKQKNYANTAFAALKVEMDLPSWIAQREQAAYERAEQLARPQGTESQQWERDLQESVDLYAFAEKCGGLQALGKSQQVREEKLLPLQRAQGYILNKLLHLLPFTPDHPLFQESTAFMNRLYPYSPTVVDLGAYLLREVLARDMLETQKRDILQHLGTC